VEEKLRCPACASRNSVKESTALHSGYGLRLCLHCNLQFSDPMLAADSDWYSSSWLYGLREDNTRLDGRKRSVPWNFAEALRVLRPAGGMELLDVGCAEGHFLWLAQEAGFHVTGLDFNPVSLQIAREVFGISSIYQCSVEELARQFPNTSYDVVTLFEVLEHTANPFETLCSLHQVLKLGGQFCISVPGFKRWPTLFHPEVDSPPHHLTLWTEEALQRLLERAGFRVLSLRAKRLSADDLGVHLKWRLQRFLQKIPRGNGGKPGGEKSSRTGKPTGITRSKAVHRMAKGALAPVCWTLRINPKAGGFTLFANCQKI
jgi:SAM-dependent methyltransferase